jgi:hypothetical protein
MPARTAAAGFPRAASARNDCGLWCDVSGWPGSDSCGSHSEDADVWLHSHGRSEGAPSHTAGVRRSARVAAVPRPHGGATQRTAVPVLSGLSQLWSRRGARFLFADPSTAGRQASQRTPVSVLGGKGSEDLGFAAGDALVVRTSTSDIPVRLCTTDTRAHTDLGQRGRRPSVGSPISVTCFATTLGATSASARSAHAGCLVPTAQAA